MQTQSNFNLDRTFFIVLSELDSGEIVQREMELDWDRQTVLEMASDGHFDNVLQIIECNPAENDTRVVPGYLIEDEIDAERKTQRYAAARFPAYSHPNDEHRIGNFEAGTGSHGAFGGRAA